MLTKLEDFRSIAMSAIETSLSDLLAMDRSIACGDFLEASAYGVFPPGKRLRPMLSLCVASDLGGNWNHILGAACSIEILHCASLVHDDLPALDNDEMRRGRPTLHKQFGEDTAVLIGDYLVPLAMSAISQCQVSTDAKVDLYRIISMAYRELCVGQYMDTCLQRSDENILTIHALKTGSLFRAALVVGAHSVELSAVDATLIGDFGLELGVSFQRLDDYLDAHGSDAARGRTGSSDRRNNRYTEFGSLSAEIAKGVMDKVKADVFSTLNKLEDSLPCRRGLPLTRQICQLIFARI